MIHSREAAAETLEVLRGFAGRVVLHCFALPDDLRRGAGDVAGGRASPGT